MARTKNVIILIVEGKSDESFLFERLHELARTSHIHFVIENGDILNRQYNHKGIKATIGDVINKLKFKKADIKAIFHIIDTDGSLIDSSRIQIDTSQKENTIYHADKITVKNNQQKGYIEKRNDTRKSGISTMNSTDYVIGGKIFYQMYYFSCHLEHILFDKRNPAGETKISNVDDFLDELEMPIEEFLMEWMPSAYDGTADNQYKSTWDYIGEEYNSLKRATNVPLLFKQLENLTD